MNTKNVSEIVRWIGLATVRPHPQNSLLGAATRAIVAVVGDASSSEMFLHVVERELTALEFDTLNLEDVEHLSSRLERIQLPPMLLEAINAINVDSPVAFGSFHTFAE